MTNDLERVPVPTNGKGPHPAAKPEPPPIADEPLGELNVNFTPTQIAVGFGIVASLVLLAARQFRRRGRR
jgi:hypothetical protein